MDDDTKQIDRGLEMIKRLEGENEKVKIRSREL